LGNALTKEDFVRSTLITKTSARFASTLAALSLLAGAATALGAPIRDSEFATKVVRFKDLDLATAAGAETLYERIAAAARIVCRGAPYADVRSCRTRAVDDAVRTIGSPLLSSMHRSTAGGVEEVVLR
jgi:UrcA family protein